MTTSSIQASGGVYTTPQAWEDDAPATLIADWIGQCAAEEFTATASVLTMTGIDRGPFVLRCEPQSGAGHTSVVGSDGPLAFNTSGSYARFRTTGSFSSGAVFMEVDGAEVEGLQLAGDNSNFGGVALRLDENNVLAENMIIAAPQGGSEPLLVTVSGGTVVNSLIQQGADVGGISISNFQSLTVANCTVVCDDSVTSTLAAMAGGGFSSVTAKNSLFCGFQDFTTGTGTWTISDCTMDDAATGQPTGTNLTYSATYADQFESLVTPDYRLKTGSDGENNGTRDQALTADLDIYGTARDTSTPDQGAFEIPAAAAGGMSPAVLVNNGKTRLRRM